MTTQTAVQAVRQSAGYPMLINRFGQFLKDEGGVVTAEWVVLTAAVAGIGIATVDAVGEGVTSLASDVASDISSKMVKKVDGTNP